MAAIAGLPSEQRRFHDAPFALVFGHLQAVLLQLSALSTPTMRCRACIAIHIVIITCVLLSLSPRHSAALNGFFDELPPPHHPPRSTTQ